MKKFFAILIVCLLGYGIHSIAATQQTCKAFTPCKGGKSVSCTITGDKVQCVVSGNCVVCTAWDANGNSKTIKECCP